MIRKERNGFRTLAVFSAVHFLVDFCCILLLTAFVVPLSENRLAWIVCLVLYNMFAFAFQLPAGAFGDRYCRPAAQAAFGCALIVLAFCILWTAVLISGIGDPLQTSGSAAEVLTADPVMPRESAAAGSLRYLLPSVCVIAGVGNACFHVGGGIDTLRNCGGRAAEPGIFVSTGAFGVFLAPALAARNPGFLPEMFLGILLMAGSCACLLFMDRTTGREKNMEADLCTAESARRVSAAGRDFRTEERSRTERGLFAILAAAVFCLFLTICLRSYAGGLMGFSWRAGFLPGFLFTACAAGGKAAGGITGDRFGWIRTAACSLLLALLLFFPAENHPLCGMSGVLFFNMTMPLTLSALTAAVPGREGTAFGFTTFALFLGTLPSVAEILTGTELSPEWMLAAVTIVSVPAVFAGIAGVRKYKRDRA